MSTYRTEGYHRRDLDGVRRDQREQLFEIPGNIEGIDIYCHRIAQKYVHWSIHRMMRDGRTRFIRGETYGGYLQPSSDEIRPEEPIANLLIKNQSRLPCQPFIAQVDVNDILAVYEPGLFWCPRGFQYWQSEEEAEESKGIFPYRQLSWEHALRIAEKWLSNYSFKIRRDPRLANYARLWETPGPTYGPYHRFLQSIGRGVSNKKEAVQSAKRAVLRHVRKHKESISRDALRFFQMFAGAKAIQSALN